MNNLFILLLLMLCLLNFSCNQHPSTAHNLHIAAASDTVYLFQSLKKDFEAAHPDYQLQVAHAASGTLVTQIEQGAPFDLFFSADDQYPRHLITTGHALEETLFNYGTGQLIIWLPQNTTLNKQSFKLTDLQSPLIKKISIANPAHAPFGKLAQQVLDKIGLYEKLKPKFIYAENISQAFQYVHSGNADVGLISLSLTKKPDMDEGTIITIPDDYSPYLTQSAIEIKNSANPEASQKFLAYLKTDVAQKIFLQHGFRK